MRADSLIGKGIAEGEVWTWYRVRGIAYGYGIDASDRRWKIPGVRVMNE